MPTLETNTTHPWLISQTRNVPEMERRSSVAWLIKKMKIARPTARLNVLLVIFLVVFGSLGVPRIEGAENTNPVSIKNTNSESKSDSKLDGEKQSSMPFYQKLILLLFGSGGAGLLIVQAVLKRWDEAKKTKQAKLAEREIEKKIKSSETTPVPRWNEEFRKEIIATRKTASSQDGDRGPHRGAEIVVVASGKGGVGKSTISLGLFEYYSRQGKALLVDFDMHNRGLTSLFGLDPGSSTALLTEMERFHDLFGASSVKDEKEPDQELVSYLKMRETFARVGDRLGDYRSFDVNEFKGDPVIPVCPPNNLPVNPNNCSFLPCLTPPNLFLSSKVFNAGFKEVYYFVKCLAYWAATPKPPPQQPINTIILDCHGAHDLFMVGAIHAATRLVIVATPEPGSFDGTRDLVEFARGLQLALPSVRFKTAVVLNNCRKHEAESIHKLRDYFQKKNAIPLDHFVTIQSDESIRNLCHGYQVGAAAKNKNLWSAIAEMHRDGSAETLDARSPEKDSS